MNIFDLKRIIGFIGEKWPDNYSSFLDDPRQILGKLEIQCDAKEQIAVVEFLKQNAIYLIGKNKTQQVTDDLTEGLSYYNKKLKETFNDAIVMYKILFGLGIGLIILGILLGLFTDKKLLASILGGIGGASSIYNILFEPVSKLQTTVAKYTKLQMVYYNWFEYHRNVTHYVGGLGFQDKMTFDEILKRYIPISEITLVRTKEAVQLINDIYTDKGSNTKKLSG